MYTREPKVPVTKSDEEKIQPASTPNRFVFIKELFTALTTGAFVGVLMVPFSLLTRKMQLSHEAKLTGKEQNPVTNVPPTTTPAVQYSAAKIIGTANSAAQTGARKNLIIGHRDKVGDKVSDLINGEKSAEVEISLEPKIAEEEALQVSAQETEQAEQDILLEQKTTYSPSSGSTVIQGTTTSIMLQKKEGPSLFTQVFAPSVITAGIDALFMNPSSNRNVWKTTCLLNPTFHMPEIKSLGQKLHAATTGLPLRFAKGVPSIFGLLMQPFIMARLPNQMSDQSKILVTAGFLGVITGPIITGVDNFHNLQLSTVKPNCSTESVFKLLKKHGPKVLKPTPATLAAGITFQAALQLVVPAADKAVRTQVIPRVTQTCHGLSCWTNKKLSDATPDMSYRDDPCFTFGC